MNINHPSVAFNHLILFNTCLIIGFILGVCVGIAFYLQ
jgi:hypothetical protein